MGFINCPECKHLVSSQAPACPHCGILLAKATATPPAKPRSSPWRAVALGLFGVAAVLLIASMAYIDPNGSFTLGAPPMQNIIACLVVAALGIIAVYMA